MSTSLRVCSSTICSKFNVQIWVSHSQFEHYFYSNLYERAQKSPRKLEYLTIKFSSSEKATKSCAIVLMVLMFTRHYLVIFFSFLYIQMWFHAQLAQKTVERFSLSSGWNLVKTHHCAWHWALSCIKGPSDPNWLPAFQNPCNVDLIFLLLHNGINSFHILMLDCIFINHLNNFQSFVLICRVKHVKMHMHINLEYCFRKDFIPLCSTALNSTFLREGS